MKNKHLYLAVVCCLVWLPSVAQNKIISRIDSMNFDSIRVSRYQFVNNIFQQAINSIRKTPEDASNFVLNGKSEAPYIPYQGKIIRKITVKALDFESSFTDTTHHITTIAGKVADALHTNTRAFVVRNNLFIKEHTPLNPYTVADNERYLRTLDYIHDARILVKRIPDEPDSVDIEVVTKDFFNLAAAGAADGVKHIEGDVIDNNIAGMGQTVQVSGLYDRTRSPNWDFGAMYKKDNVGHSFTDATVGYSRMNNSGYTGEEETTAFFRLDRPLVSPYTRLAGAFLISHNFSYNSYHRPDSVFFGYDFNVYDGWIGYNLGANKMAKRHPGIRNRTFLSVRYFDHQFTQVPAQVGNKYDPVFNNQQALLAQVTFFRQDYFKTQYIYGFGTTEDLPYGYNISLTSGWHKQLNLERPYGGLNALRYIATDRGDFIQLFLRAGGFLHYNKLEDAGYLVGFTAFSRIFFLNNIKIRQYVTASYTHLFDRVTSEPLRINNDFGIGEFLTDSVYGARRLSLQLETVFFLKKKILGFSFAPFPHADISLITPENQPFGKSSVYSGVGGGIRARNENLVFQTIELRGYFFPIAPNNMRGFKIILNSNIRYRYVSNYITAPDLLRLNSQ